ncbi:MAG: zinc-binding dehydrogenase [Calditrichota bacterium]
MASMQALVKKRPQPDTPWERGLRLVEKPIPEVRRADDVKVRVVMAAMCGTDIGIYQSRDSVKAEMMGNRAEEVITGHEFCAEVEDAGELARLHLARMLHERYVSHEEDQDVQSFIRGRTYEAIADDPSFLDFLREKFYITSEMHIVCGVCYSCRTGNGHHCHNTIIKGVHEDGIFTKYAVVPAGNTMLIRKGEIPPEVIAYMDAFGNAVHTVQSINPMGASIAVLGIGVQGLMAAAIARWNGASYIVATDFSNPEHGYTPEKLAQQRFRVAENIGVDVCFDMAEPDAHQRLVNMVMHQTHSNGVDAVFEMSGSAAAYRDGLDIIRTGGTFSLLGLPNEPVTVDFSDKVIFRGITLKGIIGRNMFQTWETMYRLLKSGMADLMLQNGFVSHKFRLSEYEEAFRVHAAGDAIKVILMPE